MTSPGSAEFADGSDPAPTTTRDRGLFGLTRRQMKWGAVIAGVPTVLAGIAGFLLRGGGSSARDCNNPNVTTRSFGGQGADQRGPAASITAERVVVDPVEGFAKPGAVVVWNPGEPTKGITVLASFVDLETGKRMSETIKPGPENTQDGVTRIIGPPAFVGGYSVIAAVGVGTDPSNAPGPGAFRAAPWNQDVIGAGGGMAPDPKTGASEWITSRSCVPTSGPGGPSGGGPGTSSQSAQNQLDIDF